MGLYRTTDRERIAQPGTAAQDPVKTPRTLSKDAGPAWENWDCRDMSSSPYALPYHQKELDVRISISLFREKKRWRGEFSI